MVTVLREQTHHLDYLSLHEAILGVSWNSEHWGGGGGQSLSFQLVHAEVCYLKHHYKPYYVIPFNGYDSSAYVGCNHATDEISSTDLMATKLYL